MQNFSKGTLALIAASLMATIAEYSRPDSHSSLSDDLKQDLLKNLQDTLDAVSSYFEAETPKMRPATDYERAMSGKDWMPASTTPWHE